MEISYINEHKIKRIEGYKPIQHADVKIGNIIFFNYNASHNNKNPHVLVLNNFWKNKLHGLIIDYMSILQLSKLRDFIIEEAEEVDPGTEDNLDRSLQELSKNSSQTPNVFYDVRLKQYLKKYFPSTSVYRTYEIIGMSNMKLVIYNFSKGLYT